MLDKLRKSFRRHKALYVVQGDDEVRRRNHEQELHPYINTHFIATEELARRLIAQSGGQLDAATELLIRQHASLQFPSHNGGNVKVNHDGARSSDPNGPPPALPPRSHHHHLHQSPTTPQQQPPQQLQPLQQQQQHHHHSQGEPPPPPRVPILTPQSGNDNGPPPPPPPRKSQVPPPTPPRGSTPPPSSSKASVTNSMLRRMSPVPGRGVAGSAGPSPVPSSMALNRGTSPVVVNSNSHHHPLRVQNSREIQQQLQQTLQNIQSMSIFPMEGSSGEPPPPYPMGTAAQGHTGANPPPSYTQSLAMRQSPTLSSTSSDYRLPSSEYRRSPGPNLLPTYHPYLATGGTGVSIAPTSPAPSPASSMLSSSSRTSSSMQAWSARQTKTHSPIIMQSVKSTQVQKPVLQTATPLAQQMAQNEANASSAFAPSSPMLVQSSGSNSKGGLAPSSACVGTPFEGGNGSSTSVLSSSVGSSNGSKAVPPPSYEFSIQQKHHGPKVALPPSPTSSRTTPTDLSQPQLPPPPPYPSTAVSALNAQKNEESGLVSGKYLPVISTAAKVMLNSSSGGLPRGGRNEPTGKPPLQRKYSPSESTMISTSRSESPNSDSVTVSAASPLSFMSSEATTTSDSGLGSEPKTTHHTSPKPERKKLSPEKEVSRRESLVRNCPPQAYKFFMEQRIENVIKEFEQRRQRQRRLEHELVHFNVKDPVMSEQMRLVLQKKETNYLRMKRAKLNRKHFKKIKKIGVGAFGEVSLVRAINSVGSKSGGLYAMKTLKKSHVVEKNQVAHVIAEKDILAEADNDWIVKLYYSFQDQDNLYFVMEYIPGGDLMSLLIKWGTFSEDLARFYIAELTCAVESVHSMGFIHRDIKPDNILIDAGGHIKLTDFGLCTGFRWTHNSKYYGKNGSVSHCRQDSMDPGTLDLELGKCSCSAISSSGMKPLERRKRQQLQRCMAHSLVGTPNYIAPEVLLRHGYTQLCDWWSVGVILYEMIIGSPPFHADSPAETQYKVIKWEQTLNIPRVPRITKEAEDLIKGLCVNADRRLGREGGSADIKHHPFFHGIDFSRPLRNQKAPYKPDILHELDTSNFDPIDEDGSSRSEDESNDGDDPHRNGKSKKDYHGFYEFTFRRFFDDGGHPLPLEESGGNGSSNSTATASSGGSTSGILPPDPIYV
ncbi:serine/threonine-protein kinase Warts-like isoform X2 [Tigriopus californicus]|uniref:serine/threonine-protein kinase Warts-like isoform X2 n=1 Tax=Tigriopus californicus TaxID=6832 RepID=UPI0027DA8BE1|nr:serine/threonine-protein kinase Warts-like isoform X2 [Tigriopus californicus]